MAKEFNPPPNWPAPPTGWSPPAAWQPDPAWGPPPPGWKLWKRPNQLAYPITVLIGIGLAVAGTGVAAGLGVQDLAYTAGQITGWALMAAVISGTIAHFSRHPMRWWQYLGLTLAAALAIGLLRSMTGLNNSTQT